jgi:hypothetical protein
MVEILSYIVILIYTIAFIICLGINFYLLFKLIKYKFFL